MWAGAGEEAAASANIYVCLRISAAKRPPVAYKVPLCAKKEKGKGKNKGKSKGAWAWTPS